MTFLLSLSLLLSSCSAAFVPSDTSENLTKSNRTNTVKPIPDIPMRETEETEAMPDFYFSITWDANGSQTYDSATGKLANDLHSTTLILTEEEMAEIAKLIEDADIDSFDNTYKGAETKPASVMNLTVTVNGKTKTIKSNLAPNEPGSPTFPEDEKTAEFAALCYNILTVIGNTEEYQNLPTGTLYM